MFFNLLSYYILALPAFPTLNKVTPSVASGEKPPHIPSNLPAFPEPHTYQATPVYTTQETDSQQIRATRLKLSSMVNILLYFLVIIGRVIFIEIKRNKYVNKIIYKINCFIKIVLILFDSIHF